MADFKAIPVSGQSGRGLYVLVSPEDFDRFSRFKWYMRRDGYVARKAIVDGVRRHFKMHREVLDAPAGLQVDHINGRPLDNRRENLRLVTPSENAQNLKGARCTSSTGVRGVFVEKGRYRVRLWKNGKGIQIGYFTDLAEATEAARRARALHFTHSSECSTMEAVHA